MKFYGVKISRDSKELLEIIDAESEREARKILACRYMSVVLSCQTSLAVLKRSEYMKMCA